MKSINRKYCKGTVMVLFAISLVALIGMFGLAIDSGMAYGVKAKLSSAVDAAAIAGARVLGTGANDSARIQNAQAAATKFFNANFPNNYFGATPSLGSVTATHNPNGYWNVSVTASAVKPTHLVRVLNFNQFNVSATAESIRRDLDMMLVLDTSGSLSGVFSKVQSAAVKFINKFIDSSDRVGLVAFASGAELKVAINKTSKRGFNKTTVINAINALNNGGATASAEGMRVALNEINLVPTSIRSSQRVIVFFSDGAPNQVSATFQYKPTNQSTQTVTGDLYSETSSGSAPTQVYREDKLNTLLGTYSNITTLPNTGFMITGLANIPLASFNNKRSTFTYTNTRCNVNKAARNMLENVANSARGWSEQPIAIYTLGLGSALNSLEVTFCGYGNDENGANILKRLANTIDSDTHQNTNSTTGAQPTGLYCYADITANPSALDNCFSAIASDILRLTK